MLPQEQNREVHKIFSQGLDTTRKSRSTNPFFGITSERAGIPENAIALKLIAASGEQKAVHYHDIISPLDYDGIGKIILSTLGLKITIEGSDLEELFDYIIEHRVKWITEPQSSFEEVEEGKPKISGISFETLQ